MNLSYSVFLYLNLIYILSLLSARFHTLNQPTQDIFILKIGWEEEQDDKTKKINHILTSQEMLSLLFWHIWSGIFLSKISLFLYSLICIFSWVILYFYVLILFIYYHTHVFMLLLETWRAKF